MAETEFARFIDRHTFEYTRIFPHPIDRVWRAITDPAHISDWFWTARFDLRLDAAFQFGPDVDGIKGFITKLDPPRLIRFAEPPDGPPGYFEFSLTPVEGGTRLALVQHGGYGARSADWPPPGLLAGWHRNVDHLGVFLDGGVWVRSRTAENALAERYRQRMAADS